MKILLSLSLCLTFTVSVISQEKQTLTLKRQIRTFKNHKNYSLVYNRINNETSINFDGGVIAGDGAFLFDGAITSFGFGFNFKGQELKETPNQIIWKFASFGHGLRSTLKHPTLYVTSDGEKFQIKEGLQDETLIQNASDKLENSGVFIYGISRSVLQKFANAKTLMVKVTEKSYVMTTQQQEIIKDVLSISNIK